MFITLRLAGLAAVLSVALVPFSGRPFTAFVVINMVVIAAAAADVLLAPAPSSLAPLRVNESVVTMGRESAVTLRLRNPRSRSLRIAIRDASPPSLGRLPVKHKAILPPGRTSALVATLTPAARGRKPIGPITVRATGPLGLAGRQRTLPVSAHVKVYPSLPGRAQAEMRIEHANALRNGQRSSAYRGGGTEFDSLRDYHPDDEFRRINWRATARAQRPIVNTYREEQDQQVLLLLDAGRMMAATIEGASRFEHAIDAAMTLAELSARVGDRTGVLAFGKDVISSISPRSGRSQSRRILDALYNIKASTDAPNYRLAFARLLGRHRRRALLVLFTELADEAALDPLFEAVPALTARHLVLVCSISDPAIATEAELMPEDAAQAYRKAAALDALAARERSAARLRSLGARVIDKPPGVVAGAVADSYLGIKALGKL